MATGSPAGGAGTCTASEDGSTQVFQLATSGRADTDGAGSSEPHATSAAAISTTATTAARLIS